MAINVTQAYVGQPIRKASAGELINPPRGSPEGSAAPVSETELQSNGGPTVEAINAPDVNARALAPQGLDRAVEAANALAEVVLRATNRSVTFSKDNGSGRIQITIRENGPNGEEVLRQIPPSSFFKLVESLKAMNDGTNAHRGALVDFDI